MVHTGLGGQVQADLRKAQEPGKPGNLSAKKQKTEEVSCGREVHD